MTRADEYRHLAKKVRARAAGEESLKSRMGKFGRGLRSPSGTNCGERTT